MQLEMIYLDRPLMIKRAVDIAIPQADAEGRKQTTALLYVHGGGWNLGAREQFHHHLEHFSLRGYWAGSVGYRLAPGAKWQEQLKDVMEGYGRFLQRIDEAGDHVDRVIVIGSSAGAHLASLLALMEPWQLDVPVVLAEGQARWRKPDACVSINGPGSMERWDDMNELIRESIERVAGVGYDDETDVFAKMSPDRYVRAGCPDFLFLIVEREKYFPHPLVYRMSDSIRAAGSRSEVVYFEDADHGFFYGISSPLQQKALAVLEKFVEAIGAAESSLK
ncbi:alpha/beta hydrolase [Paenibacillus koleovorans]|uniref:alpha/beta hydrolase n=1 Tax=Paenibacillus koleovorans TaxID=121608 RepID=UPI000FD821A3|nr:alpha/beta hydrolase [Paenibacillus koleovorans]